MMASRMPSATRWHSLKSNPLTSAMIGRWGRHFVVPKVSAWVFCAATGRCGTNTLADMMALHPAVRSLHEPYPQPSHAVLRALEAGDTGPLEALWRSEKLPRMLWAARGHRVYLETTHLFVHTFTRQALEQFGGRMKLIHLHRDVARTAQSFLGRGQDPLDNPWLIHPAAPGTVLDLGDALLPGGAFDDHYLRLVWYCHEVHARALRFAARHPQVALFDLATEDLNDTAAMTRLMEWIGVEPDPAVLARCGLRSNASDRRPAAPAGLDAGRLAALEERIDAAWSASGLAEGAGIASLVAQGQR